MWPFEPKTISAVAQNRPDISRLRKRLKVLVIDDDPNAFPDPSTLIGEGYNITAWNRVENIQQLESGVYDIIVLDIGGVATKWGPDDGLEVLRLLKASNPAQYIIAFSGQKSIHELAEFWKLADAQLKKPVTLAQCKETLDSAMLEVAQIERHWGSLKARLRDAGIDERSIAKMEKRIAQQIHRRDTSSGPIQLLLTDLVRDDEVRAGLVKSAARLLTAFSG